MRVQVIAGALLVVLGVVAIAIAPQIMNEAEIGTLRKIGGAIAGVGVLVAIVGLSKKQA